MYKPVREKQWSLARRFLIDLKRIFLYDEQHRVAFVSCRDDVIVERDIVQRIRREASNSIPERALQISIGVLRQFSNPDIEVEPRGHDRIERMGRVYRNSFIEKEKVKGWTLDERIVGLLCPLCVDEIIHSDAASGLSPTAGDAFFTRAVMSMPPHCFLLL